MRDFLQLCDEMAAVHGQMAIVHEQQQMDLRRYGYADEQANGEESPPTYVAPPSNVGDVLRDIVVQATQSC